MTNGIRGKISAKDLLELKPDILDALKESITFDLLLEVDLDGQGNFVKAIPNIHDKWTDGINIGDISSTPGLDKFFMEGPLAMQPKESELIAKLVKMADKFDQEGEFELAAEVDNALQSLGAVSNPALKNEDEEVKKNLIRYIYNALQNIESAKSGLNELFRRLRYFDATKSIKEMGLDRAVKEMEKTHSQLDAALSRMYEMTQGKRPSKANLEQMLNDGAMEQTALDFFDSKAEDELDADDKENTKVNGKKIKRDDDKELEIAVEVEVDEEEDIGDIEELLKEFWEEREEDNED